MRLKAALLSGWMVFFLAGCRQPAATLQANHANIVFQIGTFDRSSAEFAGGTLKQPVNFNVGEPTIMALEVLPWTSGGHLAGKIARFALNV